MRREMEGDGGGQNGERGIETDMIRCMKRWLTISFLARLLIVPFPGEAWNVPDGFQRLKWGMDLASVRALPEYEFIRLDQRGPIESWVTKKAPPVGSVKIEYLEVRMIEGKLSGIFVFFPTRHWEVMRDAAILKFGEPTDRHSPPREILVWKSKRLTIEAVQFVNYQSASIVFGTEGLVLAEKVQKQREREEAVRGFGAQGIPGTKQAPREQVLRSEISASSGKADDPTLSYYLAVIQAKVSARWTEPSTPRLGQEKRVSINMVVLRSGLVREIRIVDSSGDKGLDQSALQAVNDAVPLPPLPPLYSEETLPVLLHFVVGERGGRIETR